MTLPETGAPGTARGLGPCTPAGRSPAVRAGSARGTRSGCSCKDGSASGRAQTGCCHRWGSTHSPPRLRPPGQTPCSLESSNGARKGEDTSTAGPMAARSYPKRSTSNSTISLPHGTARGKAQCCPAASIWVEMVWEPRGEPRTACHLLPALSLRARRPSWVRVCTQSSCYKVSARTPQRSPFQEQKSCRKTSPLLGVILTGPRGCPAGGTAEPSRLR